MFLFPILAAITINLVSPTTITSEGDVVTISASASGLTSSTQYLQVGFTKEGSNANYLGFSKNLSDSWYQYKSSPTTADFSSYFYSFTPVSGNWSGQIQAKIDSSDSGYSGSGNYTVKLMKYITSSTPLYSNDVTIAINISQPPPPPAGGPPPSPPSNPITTPTINWTTVSATDLGTIFQTTFTLTNFDANTSYYIKIRGGADENDLNKVQTQGGSGFLSDTDNWNQFPKVTTNSDGGGNGIVFGKVTTDKLPGPYKIRLRVHKQNGDNNYDSTLKDVVFSKPASPSVSPSTKTTASQSSAALLAGLATTSSHPIRDFVLGTQSAAGVALPIIPKVESTKTTVWSPLLIGAIAVGLCFVIGAGFIIYRRRFWPKGEKEYNTDESL